MSSIRLLAKIIHRDINKAGLTNILGQSGIENVQGESQMKLDLFAHNTMKAALMAREEVAGFALKKKKVLSHLIQNVAVMQNILF